jgi:glycosyltransferase involved in cell wall biosynthesis
MEISVIIPTYRRPQLLKKCLTALLAQKFNKRQYEIIVVTDGPDHETSNLIRKMSRNRITLIRCLTLPNKRGPAAARNFGWLNAKSSVIAFTDDDCIPGELWLSAIWNNINRLGYDAITGKVIVPHAKRPTDYEQNTAGLETAEFITANCACTKNALVKAGGFDEHFAMAWREDSDLEFKLIKEKIAIRHIDSAVVTHPVRQTRWGVSIRDQKKTQYNALLYKKFPDLYREKIQPMPPVLYYAIIIAFVLMVSGLCTHIKWLALTGFYLWISLTFNFIVKRLYTTSLSTSHVVEMVFTSFLIPFISIFWQWYGAIKYKVFFI